MGTGLEEKTPVKKPTLIGVIQQLNDVVLRSEDVKNGAYHLNTVLNGDIGEKKSKENSDELMSPSLVEQLSQIVIDLSSNLDYIAGEISRAGKIIGEPK